MICLPDGSQREPSEQPWKLASRIANSHLSPEVVLDLLLRQRSGWDIEDYDDFRRFLLQCTWHRASPELQQRIHDYVDHATGVMPLVYDTDAVIEIDEATRDLCITPWPEVMERLAPAIAKAGAEDDLRRREERARQILATKLPPKRKLKKVRVLLDELLALNLYIHEPGRLGIDAVQALQTDTDDFAGRMTFEQYVLKAGEEI